MVSLAITVCGCRGRLFSYPSYCGRHDVVARCSFQQGVPRTFRCVPHTLHPRRSREEVTVNIVVSGDIAPRNPSEPRRGGVPFTHRVALLGSQLVSASPHSVGFADFKSVTCLWQDTLLIIPFTRVVVNIFYMLRVNRTLTIRFSVGMTYMPSGDSRVISSRMRAIFADSSS